MEQLQFPNFKVQQYPPCTVKNTFLNVPEENDSSDEELYTPFERCNMSAPPVLQDPAYVRTDGSTACDIYMRLQTLSELNASMPSVPEPKELVPNPPDEPFAGVQAMKSKGSVGHPNNCKECTFHFFSAAGCRNGADCCFCHEFHPRKNGKKNRRIMRTLQTREDQDGKEIEAPVKMPDEKQEKVEKIEKIDAKQRGVEAAANVLHVCYVEDQEPDSSAPVGLTLIGGVRTFLRPSLSFANLESQRCLEPSMVFVVQPPLPPGLSLDAKTGTISGVPTIASAKAGVHVVTVKVPAQGYGGIALGDVPLTSCKLFITVRSLQSFTVMKSGAEVVLYPCDQP